MMADRIRIVVADDHEVVRAAMRHLFDASDNMTVIGAAADGAEALELVERLQPDVLVLDIRMPKVSGIEVARRTREISSDTRVLAISAYDDEDYVLALIEAGAAGYMLKTAAAGEFIDAVERVSQGEFVLNPPIARKVARLWAGNRPAKAPAEKLTSRELSVLELTATGLRNKAIAEKLGISVRSVESHLGGVYIKLKVTSRVQAVLYAVSHGLVATDKDG